MNEERIIDQGLKCVISDEKQENNNNNNQDEVAKKEQATVSEIKELGTNNVTGPDQSIQI